jgi:hypothetical protein
VVALAAKRALIQPQKGGPIMYVRGPRRGAVPIWMLTWRHGAADEVMETEPSAVSGPEGSNGGCLPEPAPPLPEF